MAEYPKYPISIRLTKEELDRLNKLAEARATSRHDLVRQMIRQVINLPTNKDILDIVDEIFTQ